jgi:hypothetical protein
MLGKGGRSELTRRVDKHEGRAVPRSVLVEMLPFISGIDVALALHIQLAKVGYHVIAQAGSY